MIAITHGYLLSFEIYFVLDTCVFQSRINFLCTIRTAKPRNA